MSVTVSADGLQGGIEFRMDALKGSISSRYFGNAAMVMEEANHEVGWRSRNQFARSLDDRSLLVNWLSNWARLNNVSCTP